MKTRGVLRRLAPAAALVLLVTGCRSFQKPKYEVGDRRLLVVPFRDLSVAHGHGYGESERGKRVVEAFRHWTERNFEPQFTGSQATEVVGRELREWTRERISQRDWRDLLRGIEADLVLIGEIREFRLREPKTVGFYKGFARASYSLINAVTGREAYAPTEIKVEFPGQKDLDQPFSEFSDPQDIERGLLQKLGEAVGKDLFGYYAER